MYNIRIDYLPLEVFTLVWTINQTPSINHPKTELYVVQYSEQDLNNVKSEIAYSGIQILWLHLEPRKMFEINNLFQNYFTLPTLIFVCYHGMLDWSRSKRQI